MKLKAALLCFFVISACAHSKPANGNAISTAKQPDTELNTETWGKPTSPPRLLFSDQDQNKVKLISRQAPRYPTQALGSASCRGEAELQFDVDDEGVPINIRIIRADGDFVGAAINAVSKWRYEKKSGLEPEDYRKSLSAYLSFDGCE